MNPSRHLPKPLPTAALTIAWLTALFVFATPPANAGFEIVDDADQLAALGVGTCPARGCVLPVISPDGRYVTFVSNYISIQKRVRHDLLTNTTSSADVSSFNATYPFISSVTDDDRFIVFETADDTVVFGDTNGIKDVFIRDYNDSSTERISVNSSEQQAVGNFFGSEQGSSSTDGRFVAFQSTAGNLAPGDGNGYNDVFLRDRMAGTTTLVSALPGGGASADGAILAYSGFHDAPSISGDGHFVVFQGTCDLLPGGCPGALTYAVLVRDLMTSTTSLVSANLMGEPRDGYRTSISRDGSRVVYVSDATDLVAGDTHTGCDMFVHDRGTTTTTRVSLEVFGNTCSLDPTISNDGRRIAFDDFNHVYLWADCDAIAPVCGDGTREPGCEQCDDGNLVDGDGCDSNCTLTACGNGIATTGEGCDDGNFTSGDGCDANCTPTSCGNGIRTSGESCEDGNTLAGDGCSATCQVEADQLTSGGKSSKECLHEFLPRPQPFKKDGVFPVSALTCTDDDPACDFGLPGDHGCQFRVAFCFNVPDPRLDCTPSDVATVSLGYPRLSYKYPIESDNHYDIAGVFQPLLGPESSVCVKPADEVGSPCLTDDDCGEGGKCGKLRFAPLVPLASTSACTEYADVFVPLKSKDGVYSAGKAKVSFKVATSPDGDGKARVDAENLKLLCNP